jgi:hypothetical protein
MSLCGKIFTKRGQGKNQPKMKPFKGKPINGGKS